MSGLSGVSRPVLTPAEAANVKALVSRAGTSILRQAALNRFYGCSGTSGLLQLTGQSSTAWTTTLKQEVEGAVTGGYLVRFNRSGLNSLTGDKALVFASESNATDTSYGFTASQNLSTPINTTSGSAAVYNQLSPAGTVNGFVPVTWPGQEIVSFTNSTTTATLTTRRPHGLSTGHIVDVTGCDLPNYNVTAAAITVTTTTAFTYVMAADPGVGVVPTVIGSYSANAVGTPRPVRPPTYTGAQAGAVQSISRSNRFALTSRPSRLDGGTRPLVGYRFFHDGTVQSFPYSPITAATRTPSAPMRNRTLQIGTSLADAVGNLGWNPILDVVTQDVFMELVYANPVLSHWDIGDSTTQNDALVTDKISSAGYRACLDVSTAALPVVYANFGASSQTSATIFAQVKAALEAGITPPSSGAVPYYSVNDGVPTEAIVQASKQLALDWLALFKKYDIPVLWFRPSMPWNALTAPQYALKVALDSWVAALAVAQGCIYAQWTGLGDGASPERWLPGLSSDGIHPNEACIESVIAPQYAAVLRRLIA